MDQRNERLSKRLTFSPERTEELHAVLSEIDAIKNTFRLTDKLLPQTINRLTHSVIVTSTGASNRIEGNRLTDDEVDGLCRNLRIRRLSTRDEQEVAGYLEMLERVLKIKGPASFVFQRNLTPLLHMGDSGSGYLCCR